MMLRWRIVYVYLELASREFALLRSATGEQIASRKLKAGLGPSRGILNISRGPRLCTYTYGHTYKSYFKVPWRRVHRRYIHPSRDNGERVQVCLVYILYIVFLGKQRNNFVQRWIRAERCERKFERYIRLKMITILLRWIQWFRYLVSS